MRVSFALAVVGLALSGCGGSGGPEAAPISSMAEPTAEGAYKGFISLGYTFTAYVLENDEFWAVYGKQSDSGFVAYGVAHGTGSYDGGAFLSRDVRDFVYTGAVDSGTLRADYVPGSSFKGEAILSGQKITFDTKAILPAEFNYDQPASLAAISGTWQGVAWNGEGGSINVGRAGALSGTLAGCSAAGSVVPRLGGKNVFDVALTLAGPGCKTPILAGSGIAVSYKTPNGSTQWLMTALESGRTSGTTFVAVR